jgi:hypothetical protein
MTLKPVAVALTVALAIGAVSCATSASARPDRIDPEKVQTLANQIEAALSQLGCTATPRQDKAAIRSTIATSGVSPREAQAALSVVQSSPGLCGGDATAVASVSQTIAVALENIGPGGGPGGGLPIGAPPAYVGGGGSNYRIQ